MLTLLRTFATAMLDSGQDVISVKDVIEHASVTTMQKYDRRGEEKYAHVMGVIKTQ